jgi:hypothetical protein
MRPVGQRPMRRDPPSRPAVFQDLLVQRSFASDGHLRLRGGRVAANPAAPKDCATFGFAHAWHGYVILHELMHLREMNHSARFWREIEQVCPEHQAAEQWLKQHADLLR